MSDLGKMVQAARAKKGMTAKQLAKRCGVAESNIVDIEAGRKIANETLLQRFVKILEVDLNTDLTDLADRELQERQPVSKAKTKNQIVHKSQNIQENPSDQWELAFGNVMRKLPVHDLDNWQITDYRLQPVINNKIDGFAPDKVVFVRVKGDVLQGLGIKDGDLLKVALIREILHNGVQLIRIGGKFCIRRVRKLDGDKILLVDFDRDSKTEIRTVKETEIVGRCLTAEIRL